MAVSFKIPDTISDDAFKKDKWAIGETNPKQYIDHYVNKLLISVSLSKYIIDYQNKLKNLAGSLERNNIDIDPFELQYIDEDDMDADFFKSTMMGEKSYASLNAIGKRLLEDKIKTEVTQYNGYRYAINSL